MRCVTWQRSSNRRSAAFASSDLSIPIMRAPAVRYTIPALFNHVERIIMFRKITGVIALATLCLTAPGFAGAAQQAAAKPDATIAFSGGSVAVGIGYSWGGGDVKYKGKTYKIKIDGLSAGEVGGAKVKAKGTVYNLKQIEDIEGTFLSGAAGGTLVGGGTRATMKNDKGVEMKIETTAKGLSLKLAAEGVKVTLEK